MTIGELEAKATENKRQKLSETKSKLRGWFKSLYNDSKADLENSHFPIYPKDYSPFDLFLDNLIEVLDYAESASDVEFVKLTTKYFKTMKQPLTDFAY